MAFVVGAVVYPNDIKRVVYYQIILIFCNCSLRLLVSAPPPTQHTQKVVFLFLFLYLFIFYGEADK